MALINNLLQHLHLVRSTPAPPDPALAVQCSPLFNPPAELRDIIYEYLFADASLAPLCIEGREIRAAPRRSTRESLCVLRTCRAIYTEVMPILYEKHDLHLLLRIPNLFGKAADSYPLVCKVPDLKRHLGQIERLSVSVEFTTGSYFTILLLRWLCLVLGQREKPLKSLTVLVTNKSSEETYLRGCRCTTCNEAWARLICDFAASWVAKLRRVPNGGVWTVLL